MDLDDRIIFHTPEGVELESQLAGLASRFIAGAIDYLIQSILIIVLVLVASSAGSSPGVLLVISVVGTFVVSYLYFVPFEVLGAGRSPGKRLSHLRVVQLSGAPVDLPASLIRNLLRLIDGATLLFVPTIASVLITARNQRPGDLAAGTVVIRDRRPLPADSPPPDPAPATADRGEAGWDASAVTPEEAAAVRRFLARRDSLDRGARRQLGLRLAGGLRGKVSGAPADLGPEAFLEALSRRLSGEAGRGAPPGSTAE